MAELRRRATVVDATNNTTWANTSSCVDGNPGENNNTYGTWTNNSRNATAYIDLGGFDFSSIPDGSTINGVVCYYRHYESHTGAPLDNSLSVVTVFDGATSIASQGIGLVASVTTDFISTVPATLAQLKSDGLFVRLYYDRTNSTTQSVCYIDWADIVVNYTPPSTTVTIDGTRTVALTNTATATVVNDAAASSTVALTNTATATVVNDVAGSLTVALVDTATADLFTPPVEVDAALTVALVDAAEASVLNEAEASLAATLTNTADAVRVVDVDASLTVALDTAATSPGAVSIDAALDIYLANTSIPYIPTNLFIVDSAANNSGAATSSTASVTYPSGIEDGDVGYLLFTVNTSNAVNDATGWGTPLDTSVSSTVLQQRVYRKELAATDSGYNLSWAIGSAQKWNVVMIVVRGDNGVDVLDTPYTSGTASSSWLLSGLTPTVNNTMLLGFHAWRRAVTGTTSSTPPTGWTEELETSGNVSASPVNGAGILSLQMQGGADEFQGPWLDGAFDGSATNQISITLAIRPKNIGVNVVAELPVTVARSTSALMDRGLAAALPVYVYGAALPEGVTYQDATAVLPVTVARSATGTAEWEEKFEGGADGDSIETTNTTFDTVGSAGPDQTFKFETAGTVAPEGSTYGQFYTAAANARRASKYFPRDTTSRHYFRFFMRTATPTAAECSVFRIDEGTTPRVQVRRTSSGALRLSDGWNSRYVTTKTLGVNEWVRVEVRLSEPTSTIRLLLWWGPQLHDETQSGDYFEASTFATWTPAAYDRLMIGVDSPGDVVWYDFDAVAYRLGAGTADYIGSPYTNEATRLLSAPLTVGFTNSADADVISTAKNVDAALPVSSTNTADAAVVNDVAGSLAVAFSDSVAAEVTNEVAASLSVALTDASAATVDRAADAALPVTFTDAADAEAVGSTSAPLAVAFSNTAAALVLNEGGATLDAALDLSASVELVRAADAALPVTFALTADTAGVVDADASLSVGLSDTVSGVAVRECSADLPVQVSASASGGVDRAATASLPLALSNTADAYVVNSAAAALPVTFTTLADLDTQGQVSAAAALPVTFTNTASGVVVRGISSELPIVGDLAAAAAVVNEAAPSLPVVVELTADTAVTRGATAALPVTLAITADTEGTVGVAGSLSVTSLGAVDAAATRAGDASLDVAVAGSAAADVLQASEAAASLTVAVAGSADASIVGGISATLDVSVNLQGTAVRAAEASASLPCVITQAATGTAVRGGEGAIAVAFDASGSATRAVNLSATLPIDFDPTTDPLLGVGVSAPLDLDYELEGLLGGTRLIDGDLALDLDLDSRVRTTTARKELEAHLWSLVKPLGGTRLFSVAGLERAHGWVYTLVVQVDSRGSSKKDSRDKAFAAASAILSSPSAPWQTGVVTGATVVMGPLWLPDENGAPRYVARYAVTAHPRP